MTTRAMVSVSSRARTDAAAGRSCCDSVIFGPSGTRPVDVHGNTPPAGATWTMGHDQSGATLDVRDLLTIGSYNLVCVLAGMGLGWWADAAVGLKPVLTLVGLALGVVVGVLGTWVRIRPLLEEGPRDDGH